MMKQRGFVTISWRCPDTTCNHHNVTELSQLIKYKRIDAEHSIIILCVCSGCGFEVEISI